MSGKVRHYFAAGNTAKGYFSLYDSALDGLDRLFILKGGPRMGKSLLMKTIGEEMASKGFNIEYLHCPSDHDSIDGVIIPEIRVGIVDGTAPHNIEPRAPGIIDVNLGIALDSQKLSVHKEAILKLNHTIASRFQAAYDTFAAALKAHDDIEDIYISHMDFSEADKLTDELMTLFYGEDTAEKTPKVKHRFLGAATPNGAVDFIQNLTEDIRKRYFIKGRAGSGKSTMLKKIAAAGVAKGFDVEVYHCGFDPNSLDMVIIREKSIAIFDSTAPHEYFPERETDEIIDMYKRCITPGTDEKFAKEIARTTKVYKDKMKEAISYLADAKLLHDELEAYYIDSMDFSKIDAIQQNILQEMELIIERSTV